jgi:hypothetical protein
LDKKNRNKIEANYTDRERVKIKINSKIGPGTLARGAGT